MGISSRSRVVGAVVVALALVSLAACGRAPKTFGVRVTPTSATPTTIGLVSTPAVNAFAVDDALRFVRNSNVQKVLDVETVRNTVKFNAAVALAKAKTTQPSPPSPVVHVTLAPAVYVTSPGGGACGGDLPPCFVCQRESHCTYGIVSTSLGCTGYVCYGKWQFDPKTYTNLARQLGFPTLFDASGNNAFAYYHPERWSQVTPYMEDAAARLLWAGGGGCGAWNAC